MSYSRLLDKADLLYFKTSRNYQEFIDGMAIGANIPLSDAKILNAMETYGSLIGQPFTRCAFAYAGINSTYSGSSIIGRNYDYPEPFNIISKNLVITVINAESKIPVATIAMAGQIYCPSCLNKDGIFIELNNGSPSGGSANVSTNKTMLVSMLEALQNNRSLVNVAAELEKEQSDYSLIVNLADATKMISIEFSANIALGSKWKSLSVENYAVTNYYLISSWGNLIPKPTDEITWRGVTRKTNLDNLLSPYFSRNLSIDNFKTMMSYNINDGGAVWDFTIYQIVYDTANKEIYIKQNNYINQWQKFTFAQIFN